ncbi:hypothetical protein [Polyangium sp. 6x1]|uniref:hypothetical protein n=1 Tax=Polyangium sp. 6x1 TaxID=3042689 RepID=UPI0024832B9A|nr:hypothetical protein [Polyangium sp. 6x1]MDI1443675.1 hypothetical protein [Polyangium sp. 6x1]
MGLLDRGNNEFSTSVTRSWLIANSAELTTLLTALGAFQNDDKSVPKLVTLYGALYNWGFKKPKEYARRGRLANELRNQIVSKAVMLQNVHALGEFNQKFMTLPPSWSFLQDITTALAPHVATLKNIEITDRPTGVPGAYDFTAGNVFAEQDRNHANIDTTEVRENKQYEPKLWLRLGRRVVTPQTDGKGYGRCFSCAAAAIYKMVMDPAFDDYMIEHVGAEDYDHHLVLVDRPSATGVNGNGLNDGKAAWLSSAAAIDVWQGNLNGNTKYASIASDNVYVAGSTLKWFCAFPPSRRALDREFANGLRAPQRNPVDMGQIQRAREALQNAPGPKTRNRKGLDGKWIVEKLVGENWVKV